MVRPHVTNPGDLPPGVVPASNAPDEVTVPLDPKNWEIVTDAMAQVVSPVGTAALSQIKGVDMAGKTGSAQTISNMLKAKMSASEKAQHKDNGWFVGVEPRRNPEIVVCGLYEEGEHGDKTARVVAQVIKAFVDKQRSNPPKMADKPRTDGKVEIGAVWTAPDSIGSKDKLQSGRFVLDMTAKGMPLATAAPGLR
jgi:penicillin-binding protein 2